MRPIQSDEKPLVEALFTQAGLTLYDSLRVEDLDRPNQGLLLRKGSSITRLSVSSLEFQDSDGVAVRAVLNCTAEGHPAEIEINKSNQGQISRWPKDAEIESGIILD